MHTVYFYILLYFQNKAPDGDVRNCPGEDVTVPLCIQEDPDTNLDPSPSIRMDSSLPATSFQITVVMSGYGHDHLTYKFLKFHWCPCPDMDMAHTPLVRMSIHVREHIPIMDTHPDSAALRIRIATQACIVQVRYPNYACATWPLLPYKLSLPVVHESFQLLSVGAFTKQTTPVAK